MGGPVLRGLVSEFANWQSGTRGTSCVYIHALRVVRSTICSLGVAGIAHVLIECLLAIGNTIRFGCGLLGLLLLDLLVGLSLGDDVGQELEVFYASDCVCCTRVSGMLQI